MDMKAKEEEDNIHGESLRDYCGEQQKNQCDLKWWKIITDTTNAANMAHDSLSVNVSSCISQM